MLTILVPARNASATIARAVASARAQHPARIVLIDHASTDGTVEEARREGGADVLVVTAPAGATRGQVRQMGLDALESDFGLWLEADAELLPGRAERLLGRLRSEEADLAFDEVDLHDAATGAFVKRLPIPDLLGEGRQITRLFERNYLPAPGAPVFRADAAKRVGFDPALDGAEETDFLLRSIVAGGRVVLVRRAGCRRFAPAAPVPRPVETESAMLRAALRKHDPALVETLFIRTGFAPRTRAWCMVHFLTQRGDYLEALAWLERVPKGSRRDFHTGTLLAALGEYADALRPLRHALDDCASPELLNNFGVVLAALGRIEEAADMFADALYHLPGYADATDNLVSGAPVRLTLLPLRDDGARTAHE